MRITAENHVDVMRGYALEDLVRTCLQDVIDQFPYEDCPIERKKAQKHIEAAILNNIYGSDFNEIRTFSELTSRLQNDYSVLYLPYIKGIYLEGADDMAEAMDIMVRTTLTIFALLFCVCVNEFDRLETDYIDKVFCLSDDDKHYSGCIINTKNGLQIDTIKRVIVNALGMTMDLPSYIRSEFDVCIGYPHFTGDFKNMSLMDEPVICEDPLFEGYMDVEKSVYDNSWAIELDKEIHAVSA